MIKLDQIGRSHVAGASALALAFAALGYLSWQSFPSRRVSELPELASAQPAQVNGQAAWKEPQQPHPSQTAQESQNPPAQSNQNQSAQTNQNQAAEANQNQAAQSDHSQSFEEKFLTGLRNLPANAFGSAEALRDKMSAGSQTSADASQTPVSPTSESKFWSEQEWRIAGKAVDEFRSSRKSQTETQTKKTGTLSWRPPEEIANKAEKAR